jgi:hypothetical protein
MAKDDKNALPKERMVVKMRYIDSTIKKNRLKVKK